MKLKICGMRQTANINEVVALQPDFMGFIFYEKSARHAALILDKNTFDNIPLTIAKVGVFVDASKNEILQVAENFHFDYLQLHGNETPEFCQDLKRYGFNIIKVFSIDNDFDFNVLLPFINDVDYFLFDTKATLPGGNGIKFDWDVLKNYTYKKQFLLSGGISNEDFDTIIALKNSISTLVGIDVNSKYEIEPGLKDVEKLKQLKSIISIK